MVLAATALILATGCGGDAKHAAIVDYITRVDDVQQGMNGPLQQVTRVNQRFARSQTDPKVAVELETSERTMQELRVRLGKVQPPPEARHLHALMLQLVDREVALTRDTAQLATFVGQYQVALKPLQPASTALRKQLSAQATGRAAAKALDAMKAGELRTFATTIQGVAAAVQQLSPPPVWAPQWRDQLTTLEQLRASALALADAIDANDANAIPTLLVRFDRAAVSNQGIAAQTREIDAVKAYDKQLTGLVQLAKRIQLERVRLQKTFK